MNTMRVAVQPLATIGAVNDSSARGVNSPRASATLRLLPTAASNSATTASVAWSSATGTTTTSASTDWAGMLKT